MNSLLSTLALALSVSALSSLATYTAITLRMPTVVSVDVKGTVDAYQQALLRADLDLEEQTSRLAHFGDVLHEEIVKYNLEHHTVALVNAAVVDNAADITPDIQRAIVKRYQGGK